MPYGARKRAVSSYTPPHAAEVARLPLLYHATVPYGARNRAALSFMSPHTAEDARLPLQYHATMTQRARNRAACGPYLAGDDVDARLTRGGMLVTWLWLGPGFAAAWPWLRICLTMA
jgi:hypothetical protein